MPRSVKEWIGKTDDSVPPQSVTLRLWEKAKGKCQICGLKILIGDKWDRDHIIRLKDGGQNRESNLQLAHRRCHRLKTGKENSEGARSDRLRAAHIGAKRASKWSKWKRSDWTPRPAKQIDEM